MEFGTLLRHYRERGGSDLGEFLLGSQARADIKPPPSHALADFPGVMPGVGGSFPRLCEKLGMKGSSLKRMISAGRMDKGDAIERCTAALGIQKGSYDELLFWQLARGDKAKPNIGMILQQAHDDMEAPEPNAQAIARKAALDMFDSSGFTLEKFGELCPHAGMIKEITRNPEYVFLPGRAKEFSAVMAPGRANEAQQIARMLVGVGRQQSAGALMHKLLIGDKGVSEWSFGQYLRQVRLSRLETQEEFAAAFTAHLKRKLPGEEVSKAIVDKWENDAVKPQSHAIANVLADFLGMPQMHWSRVPRADSTVKPDQQQTGDRLMHLIRAQRLTFDGYLRMRMRERDLTQERFAEVLSTEDRPVSPELVGKWLKGQPPDARQAAQLADYEGLREEAARRDFMAFARTGKLERVSVKEMVEKLLRDEMPLADFMRGLRQWQGMSVEELDAQIGLGKGTTRNIESGRAVRLQAMGQISAFVERELTPELLERFRDKLTTPAQVPEEKRVKTAQWLERIRGGELTFTDYIRVKVAECGNNAAAFVQKVNRHGGTLHETSVRSWLAGRHARGLFAEALLAAEGEMDAPALRDFLSFVRTGKLQRRDEAMLVEQLERGELRVADWLRQLRMGEGISTAQMDKQLGVQEGRVRQIERGEAPDAAAADALANYPLTLGADAREKLRRILNTQPSVAPSETGFDSEGYHELMERVHITCGVQDMHSLREQTQEVRYQHLDQAEEFCWRKLAQAQMKEGTPKSVAGDWNALHDMLFSPERAELMKNDEMRRSATNVMRWLGMRQDEGVARRWMTGLLVRKLHEQPTEAVRKFMVDEGVTLNLNFIGRCLQNNLRGRNLIDETMAADMCVDGVARILQEDKLNLLLPMDAYFRTMVRNNVFNVLRRDASKKQSTALMDEAIGFVPDEKAPRPDRILEVNAADVLAALQDFKKQLSPDDARLLDVMLSADATKESVYDRVAEELHMAGGTVKRRVFTLRQRLAEIPELVAMLGEALGENYAQQFSARRKNSEDAHEGRA